VTFVCKYVALFVHDLRSAEKFYRRVFDMELLFRESRRSDDWYALRPGLGWDDAERRGVQIDMVALRREEFVLALFRGTPQAGTVLEVCIGMSPGDIEAVRARVPESVTQGTSPPLSLRFEDPFGFAWVMRVPATAFRSSGELSGRWLD
jgi:catechol 2,3-dioxygenase-like lactoylglutathione lyase family enzyme